MRRDTTLVTYIEEAAVLLDVFQRVDVQKDGANASNAKTQQHCSEKLARKRISAGKKFIN